MRVKRVTKSNKEARKLKPSGAGLTARGQKDKREKYVSYLPQLVEMQGKLIPFKTACDSLCLDAGRVAAWVDRYPAIRDELKRARAIGLIELQEKVAAGTQGWQALMRLAESADPEHWIRPSNTGRKGNDQSPYAAALSKVKRRVARR